MTEIYNKSIYNSGLQDLSGNYVKGPFISPFTRRFLPEYFIDQYPELYSLIFYWLEYLEKPLNPYWITANIKDLASIENTIDELLPKFREQYAPDFVFSDIENIDKRFLLKNIKSFYTAKGNKQSFEFLFRLMNKDIEIYHPIDDVLFVGSHGLISGRDRIIDSYYYTPFTYDIRVAKAYSEWKDFIRSLAHPAGMGLFGSFIGELASEVKQISTLNTFMPNTFEIRSRLDGAITDSATSIDILNDSGEFYFGTEEFPPYYIECSVDHTNDSVIFSESNSFYTGERVFIKSSSMMPSGLSINTVYYYIYVTPTSGKLASSYSNAQNNIAINFTSNGTGQIYFASVEDLIIRVDNEDISYLYTDNETFLSCTRGVGDLPAVAHTDITTFTVDTTSDLIVLSTRLNIESYKKINFSSSGVLPEPLSDTEDYYCLLVEPKDHLSSAINNSVTTISVDSTENFPSSGTIKIDGELITYTGKTSTTFTGCTRGTSSTSAILHADGSAVYLWNRVFRVCTSKQNALYKDYVDLLDTGSGTHTLTGEGVSVSLYNGVIFSKPQYFYSRELRAYTSYDDVDRDMMGTLQFKVENEESFSSITSDIIYFTSPTQFNEANLVRFVSPSSFVDTAVTTLDTTVELLDASTFPASGTISIGRNPGVSGEHEFVSYSSITSDTLNLSSAIVNSYDSGTPVRIKLPVYSLSSLEIEDVMTVKPDGTSSILLKTYESGSIGVTNGSFSSIQLRYVGEVPPATTSYAVGWGPTSSLVFSATSSGHVTQAVTGATGFLREIIDSRHFIIEQTGLTDFDSTNDLSVGDGSSSGKYIRQIGKKYVSLSDDILNQDFSDLTEDLLTNGDDEFAKEFKIFYPYITKEQKYSTDSMFVVVELNEDLSGTSTWAVDVTNDIGSWTVSTNGHLEQGSGIQGILRKIESDNKTVIIQVDPSATNNFDQDGTFQAFGRVLADSYSVEKLSGTWTLLGSPTTYARFQVASGDTFVSRVTAGGGTGTITLAEKPFPGGTDPEICQIYFVPGLTVNALEPRGIQSLKYALNHPKEKKFVEVTTVEDLDVLSNYAADTSTAISSFLATTIGHITQTISGATGIVRNKRDSKTVLDGDHTDSVTTITVNSTVGFLSSGLLEIGTEFITYTGKTSTTFTGCTRGVTGTTAIAHLDLEIVKSANYHEYRPKNMVIELTGNATFETSASYTLTVGNGTTSGNSEVILTQVDEITICDLEEDDLFMISGTDDDDPNRYQIYEVEDVYDLGFSSGQLSATSIAFNKIITFSEEMELPIAGLGDFEPILYYRP